MRALEREAVGRRFPGIFSSVRGPPGAPAWRFAGNRYTICVQMGAPSVGNSPDTQRWSAMLARSRWRAHGTIAACALLAGLVAIVLAVVLAEPAFADPSDQPGGTSGVLDSQALDKLQKRATPGQGGLQARPGGGGAGPGG